MKSKFLLLSILSTSLPLIILGESGGNVGQPAGAGQPGALPGVPNVPGVDSAETQAALNKLIALSQTYSTNLRHTMELVRDNKISENGLQLEGIRQPLTEINALLKENKALSNIPMMGEFSKQLPEVLSNLNLELDSDKMSPQLVPVLGKVQGLFAQLSMIQSTASGLAGAAGQAGGAQPSAAQSGASGGAVGGGGQSGVPPTN